MPRIAVPFALLCLVAACHHEAGPSGMVRRARELEKQGLACADVACLKAVLDDLSTLVRDSPKEGGQDLLQVTTNLLAHLEQLKPKLAAPSAPPPSAALNLNDEKVFLVARTVAGLAEKYFLNAMERPDLDSNLKAVRELLDGTGLTLADPPLRTGDTAKDSALASQYLDATAQSLGTALSTAQKRLFSLGTRSVLILVGYQPKAEATMTQFKALIADGHAAGVALDLFKPLAAKIDEGAPGDEIEQTVLTLDHAIQAQLHHSP